MYKFHYFNPTVCFRPDATKAQLGLFLEPRFIALYRVCCRAYSIVTEPPRHDFFIPCVAPHVVGQFRTANDIGDLIDWADECISKYFEWRADRKQELATECDGARLMAAMDEMPREIQQHCIPLQRLATYEQVLAALALRHADYALHAALREDDDPDNLAEYALHFALLARECLDLAEDWLAPRGRKADVRCPRGKSSRRKEHLSAIPQGC